MSVPRIRSSPASSAPPTCIERDGQSFTVRPEKVRLSSNGDSAGLHTERGRVADVAYAGSITRFVVELEAGGRFRSLRQNLDSSPEERPREAGRGSELTVGMAAGAHGGVACETKRERRRLERLIEESSATRVAHRHVHDRGRLRCGCGSDDDGAESAADEMLAELGEGEGEVNLIAWAGYVEDGSTDPKVDWVSDFEKETGCQVNVKVGNTSDEMVQLMRTGEYDGVSASGDATTAPDRGRRRRPGQHRPDPQLRRRL